MSRFRLLPSDARFFDDFVSMADQIRAGARMLKEMVAVEPPDLSKAETIKEIEHSCDERTRNIIERLNRTFVTPLDREDIHSIAKSLDDVIDAIDGTAAVMRLYRIARVRPGTQHLVEIIVESTDRLFEALKALESRKGVLELAIRINQLEREADRVHQDCIVALFDDERDPIALIKWKEIFDFMEATTDRCDDVGNLLEGVIVKHS